VSGDSSGAGRAGWRRFLGRVALVTGAAGQSEGRQGMGKAVAVELALGGAALALNDLDPDRLEASAEDLRRLGAHVTTHAGSVTDDRFVEEMAEAAIREHGRIDILHNHVGGGPAGVPWVDLVRTPVDDFRAFLELNLVSQAAVMKAVLPDMIERRYGRIVCTSSFSAVLGQEGGSGYAAAKAGLHGLVASVAKEVGRYGVTVNAVVIGNPPAPGRTAKRQEFLNRLSHLERGGRFDEFGRAIAFLLSDDASYISGAAIPVDGGILVPRLLE
jgi:NAD(P)-dependent dehydrogenase (short-subunit alcohol dehydrogenase family)